MLTPVRGRCVAIDRESGRLLVRTEAGEAWLALGDSDGPREGDLVEVCDGAARVLVRSSRRVPGGFAARTLNPRRLRAQAVRAEVEAGIRQFFSGRGFREVRTPLLVPCPGMEPHLRPFRVEPAAFLPTSPELAMKRLLVGGLEKIFQICPAFRAEPRSPTHHPEFTLLEWYRAWAGQDEIARDTEELVAFLALRLFGRASVRFRGRDIAVNPPWPRLRVRDLFADHAGVDLAAAARAKDLARECRRLGIETRPDDSWDDLYFRIWLERVEPRLPADQAVLVTRYPASQAALAVVDADPDGTSWARRFEVYAGGLELANAFEELTDPVEQRRRFEEDMRVRERVYGGACPAVPLDEEFLEALEEGMPPSGGIALGVDRLVMLLADEPDIDYTLWLPSYQP